MIIINDAIIEMGIQQIFFKTIDKFEQVGNYLHFWNIFQILQFNQNITNKSGLNRNDNKYLP